MFGLFESEPFVDQELGELVRSRGMWRGTLRLESEVVPLVLVGGRGAPEAAAVATARDVPGQLSSWRAAIQRALFEHYEPYAAALAAGDLSPEEEALPSIASPADVWLHVSLEYVSVAPLHGSLITELGYAAAWDLEHTLGARIERGRLVELCGSTLAP